MAHHSDINQELMNPAHLPAKIYKFRVLGLGLVGIAIAAVFYENQVSKAYWVWWIFACYLWPHLAYLVAKKQAQPFLAERRNLLFDSFLAGTLVSLMWFNLLPSVLFWVLSTADKANSGIKKLWLIAQPLFLLGLVLGVIVTRFGYQPATSMNVIMACLPILLVHIISVSLGSYKLLRKVYKQNHLLRKLSQKDTLTQLYNRRHWQHQVDLLLLQANQHQNLTLVLIDIDHFKQMNDKYGHSTGDEILLAIADVIAEVLPEGALAGRFGGDEFALILHQKSVEAKVVAAVICQQVAELEIAGIDSLKCTVSIGLSELVDGENDFRSWFDRADKNLYQAKHEGRNQIH